MFFQVSNSSSSQLSAGRSKNKFKNLKNLKFFLAIILGLRFPVVNWADLYKECYVFSITLFFSKSYIYCLTIKRQMTFSNLSTSNKHPTSQSASIHLYIFKVTRRRESSNRARSKGSREDVTKNSHNRPSRNVHRIRLYILGPGEG